MSNEPRLLSIAEAAAYVGYSGKRYALMAKRGVFPLPLPGTKRIDRQALDLAIDRLSGVTTDHR